MQKAKVIEVLTAEEVNNLNSLIESDLPMLQKVKAPISGAYADLINELDVRVTSNFRQSCETVKELDEALSLNRRLVGHGIEAAKKQRIDIAKMLKSNGLLNTEE
jgi:hypothetical protein